MSRSSGLVVAIGATMTAALGLWLTGGALAVTVASGNSPRIGLLPGPAWLAGFLAAAVLLAVWPGLPRHVALPLYLFAFLALPWLPFAVPGAFLLWTGPARFLVWAGVVAIILACSGIGWTRALSSRWFIDPARARLVAFLVATTLYLVAASRIGVRLPFGDEPHYLDRKSTRLNSSH